MRIHYIQHAPFEGPGIIKDWALKNNFRLTSTHIYKGELLPSLSNIDFLIILGGSMGTYEEHLHPWLKEEKKYIEAAIKTNKIVLGICLGSQLIANALGTRVYPHIHKEIGWWKVNATPAAKNNLFFNSFPKEYMAFHWHGDTFDLPQGATLMASSVACAHQAFVYGDKVVGLQFHFEVTEPLLLDFIKDGKSELVKSMYVQTAEEIKARFNYVAQTNLLMINLLEKLKEL